MSINISEAVGRRSVEKLGFHSAEGFLTISAGTIL